MNSTDTILLPSPPPPTSRRATEPPKPRPIQPQYRIPKAVKHASHRPTALAGICTASYSTVTCSSHGKREGGRKGHAAHHGSSQRHARTCERLPDMDYGQRLGCLPTPARSVLRHFTGGEHFGSSTCEVFVFCPVGRWTLPTCVLACLHAYPTVPTCMR